MISDRTRRRMAAELAAFVALKMAVGAALVWMWWAAARPAPDFAAVKAGWVASEAVLLDRHGEVLGRKRIDLQSRRGAWLSLGQVSPALLDAIVAGEDRRFREHRGVDLRAVLGAARDNLLGRGPRGASTLSMQVASLLEPASRGLPSWQRKRRQVQLARGLEERWSKDQILEAYVNLLGFRGELQGIDAAARHLAGKQADALDRAESALLAALLPSPAASPARVAARACARQRQAAAAVPCADLQSLAAQWFAAGRHMAPRTVDESPLAPQLAARLLAVPDAPKHLRTTLDAGLQRVVQEALAAQLRDLADRNVRDGAALVVDNDSGEVLAYVASAGPFSRAPQVDGVRAPRQAGSTLKPFLYALALEQRLLTAGSLIDDAPLDLDTATGLYQPGNYDGRFQGLVSLRTALASSLNLPAVRTVMLVGVDPFRDRLRALGYEGLVHDGAHYGYSLALGSAEVSLWEQARAYRALARQGRGGDLRLLLPSSSPGAAAGNADAPRPLAATASFVVADILADRVARARAFGLDNALATPYWTAVKTGTSKDMRDNWCVGFSRRHTVAVWVGNFEGDPMHDVSGVSGAAPAWRQVMDHLAAAAGGTASGPPPPAGLVRSVLSYAQDREPARREWFLAGTVPTAPVEAAQDAARAPRILSPANGMVMALDPDIPVERQRLPWRATGDLQGLSWRLGDESLGAAADAVMWQPRRGSFRLQLVDAGGSVRDSAFFTVR